MKATGGKANPQAVQELVRAKLRGRIGTRMDLAGLGGILRSVAVYRLRPGHHRGLVGLYRPLLPAGGLVFDVGAHVGDRIRAFRALGARVVAVEPGTAAVRVLRLLHGRDPQVVLVPEAVGAAPGEALFSVNSRNPTVSTLSADFVAATAGAPWLAGPALGQAHACA